jgi:hypothetical protein
VDVTATATARRPARGAVAVPSGASLRTASRKAASPGGGASVATASSARNASASVRFALAHLGGSRIQHGLLDRIRARAGSDARRSGGMCC